MNLPEEKYLVTRLNKGDRQAFEEIYGLYHQPMLTLAQRYLKEPQLAEDAVQDVLSKLWMKRAEIDSGGSLRGFIFTALRNHVLNMVKSKKRRILRQFEYSTSNYKESAHPDEEVIFTETEKIVKKGVRTLPEGKKLVYELKLLQGYSNHEIAEQMGISTHTVRSQFAKANKIVQKFVSRHIN